VQPEAWRSITVCCKSGSHFTTLWATAS